jgi:hypothetical protein
MSFQRNEQAYKVRDSMPGSEENPPLARAADLRSKAVNLFTYLKEVCQLRFIMVRDCRNYDQLLWFHEIPREPECFCVAWGASTETSESWIEVRRSRCRAGEYGKLGDRHHWAVIQIGKPQVENEMPKQFVALKNGFMPHARGSQKLKLGFVSCARTRATAIPSPMEYIRAQLHTLLSD